MKEPTVLFICSKCDAQFQKWNGRCLECGGWGTLVETAVQKQEPAPGMKKLSSSAPTAMSVLSETISTHTTQRIPTHSVQLNEVLGGGIVPGSLILLGGEPGIGKSTLALELARAVVGACYFSGEESVQQIALRSKRLKTATLKNTNLCIANETSLDAIVASIQATKAPLVIVDSIQTVGLAAVENEIGSVAQVRAAATTLLQTAKQSSTAIVIIGHVTKDGTLAGPKTLEHLVDVVLSFEGDRYGSLRFLRALKNRFGRTDEVAAFDMTEGGLVDVANPSALLLAERGDNVPGSVITCLLEGRRPLLVEVQALVNKTTFGYPVRKSNGFDINRLHMIIAVLEKRAGMTLGQYDVYINIVGGMNADDPGVDLAVAFAIASSYKNKPLGNDLCVFGELGLGGETRSVRELDKRIKECSVLGLKRVITKLTSSTSYKQITVSSVGNIAELVAKT